MEHYTHQAQMFYILKSINYSLEWKEVEMNLGYDLGDHYFSNPEAYLKIREAAKALWDIFHGTLDAKGNIIT